MASPPPPSPPGPTASSVPPGASAPVALGAASHPALPAPNLRRYKRVLHAGDSMVGGRFGLTKALGALFKEEGATIRSDSWNGVGIERFARDGRLGRLVQETKPDLVIVTLGTNDVFVPHPEALVPWIRAIVRSVEGRDCYWMGPPTWKGDTGVVAVLRENTAPCVFFDAEAMPLERVKDGIHLTDAGGATWAAAFWRFFRGAPPP
jgi:hypothetical protein